MDTDVVYDEYGIPYIPAKRIKGCITVIAVLLHAAGFGFHPCLLVAAVIGEQADSGCIFLSIIPP